MADVTFPACNYAGNQLTRKRFCRQSDRPQLVDFETCNGCIHADPVPSEQLAPACRHRGEQRESIVSCNCPRSFQKGVFDCALHGRCVVSRHNRESVKGVKCCETCKDQNRDPATQEPASLEQLAIIAVHFNPQRYCLPIRNYWEWRHHLGPLQANLTTVELSFDGSFCIPDAHHIDGKPNQVCWQKEAMINYAIRELLPDGCQYVAWIDHDLIFENQQWAEQTVRALRDRHDVVQLFDSWAHYDANGEFEHVRNSWAARHLGNHHEHDGPLAPGGAWAARRDYLERIGGILANNVVGGGDQGACDAWTTYHSNYLSSYSEGLHRNNEEWQRKAREAMHKPCGWIPGTVRHLYHGDRRNRLYTERHAILREHNFDPETDVRIGENGILEWCSDKPEMHRQLAEYFALRKEDE